MKRKILFCIISALLLVTITSIVIFAANGDLIPNNGAVITAVELVSRNTGTGPFDDNDEPGNDSSSTNDIVRSFDQITWTIENTMAINNTGDQYYTGGVIYFEATIPTELMGIARWNTDSMQWIENLEVLNDGTTIKGNYTMSDVDVTVPGKQSLVFVLDVYGAANGTKIQSTFTTWLDGNSNSERKTYTADTITVSAAPAYNIEIVKNPLNRDTNMINPDNETEELYGKVFGYGLVLSMNNTNAETKGAKGIEYPSGDITFDIELELSRWNSDEYYNGYITDIVTPLLYQYSIDGEEDNLAYNDGRVFFDMYGDGYKYPSANRERYDIASEYDLVSSIYKSGQYSLVQEGNVIHVTLKDYDFDGYFPTNYCFEDSDDDIRYSDGRKNFSLLPIQLFIPINEETQKSGDYYFSVTNTNFNATSISGKEVNTQSIDTDDENIYQFKIGEKGSFDKLHQMLDSNYTRLSSSWYAGDSVSYRGEEIKLNIIVVQYAGNSPIYDKVEDQNILFKFDGDCYEPIREGFEPSCWFNADGEEFKYNYFFAAKQDGSNWTSQDEQNNARIEDLKYYNSLDELYADGNEICVGVLLESYEGWEANYTNQSWNNNCEIRIPVKIKDTAVVGNTYSYTSDVRLYDVDLDRTIDSVSVEGFTGYSRETMKEWMEAPDDYVKTEYNERGQIIEDTHDSVYSGNTILIVDAKSTIDISVTQTDDSGNPKVNYDYGKNEYVVDYILSPSIVPYPSLDYEKKTTVFVEATLDYRTKYVYGSSNYGEPEILTNEYDDLVLRWEINDCIVGETIEPITFSAKLSEELENGEQFTAYASVYAPEVDGRNEWLREDEYTVEIIDLSSHRLYKTTDTDVTEKDGEIHYTVSYKNNTNTTIPAFQLLDILPYNGDSRGSNFNGTYRINRIDVTQWDENGEMLPDNNNLTIKYVNDESVRVTASVEDDNLGQNWIEVNSYEINDFATALAVIGEMGNYQKLVLDIYLKPEGNMGGDIYYNDATARTSETEPMITPAIYSTVVERKLSGYVWIDENKDGLMDDTEQRLSNIELKITDSLGNSINNVNGDIINSVYTDVNGYYCFEYLPESEYIVSATYDESLYKITDKEVGYNSHINSKFNIDTGNTDVITSLSTTTLPFMEVDYQNLGLIENIGKIKVLHVLEGTDVTNPELIDNVLYPTEEFSDKLDVAYTTTDRLSDIISNTGVKFELISKTDNYIGTYQKDIQYVIYYYNVLGSVTLTKVDSLDNDIKLKGARYKIEKINDDGSLDGTFTPLSTETNEYGIIIFNDLPAGKYCITEVKAPDNYNLNSKPVDIEISYNTPNLNILLEDNAKVELPSTGSKNNTLLIFFFGSTIIVTAVFIAIKR